MPVLEKATHQQTRTYNSQLVLRTVYDRPEVSRADIARLTGLTRTSVSDLIAELIDAGLVEEMGRGPSSGGKAPILLRVAPSGRHVIGLDLGDDPFTGVLVDLRGRILRSAARPLNGRDGEAALVAVYELLDELIAGRDRPLLGIGIGAPGVIDAGTGTVRWAVNLDWTDLPLAHLVGDRYGVPVQVGNDSQAAALAEYTFGDTPRPDNLVVIKVGRGIGAGLVIGGRLYTGDGSGAGEIGHTTVVEGGEPCRCGSVGCLETVASVRAILSRARHLAQRHPESALAAALVPGGPGLGPETIAAAFAAGDDVARTVVLDAAHHLGRSIAWLTGALNVRRVRIVGEVAAFGDAWLDAVRHEARERALALLAQETDVAFGRTHEGTGVLGASALLMTNELGLSLAR